MSATMIKTHPIFENMYGSSLFALYCEARPDNANRRPAQDDQTKLVLYTNIISPLGKDKSTSQMTQIVSTGWETTFTPRTELGKRIHALRMKAVDAGMKLLSEDEVLEEVKRRRGEKEENEKNLY